MNPIRPYTTLIHEAANLIERHTSQWQPRYPATPEFVRTCRGCGAEWTETIAPVHNERCIVARLRQCAHDLDATRP